MLTAVDGLPVAWAKMLLYYTMNGAVLRRAVKEGWADDPF